MAFCVSGFSGVPVLDFRAGCRVEHRAKHPERLAAEGGGPDFLRADTLLPSIRGVLLPASNFTDLSSYLLLHSRVDARGAPHVVPAFFKKFCFPENRHLCFRFFFLQGAGGAP